MQSTTLHLSISSHILYITRGRIHTAIQKKNCILVVFAVPLRLYSVSSLTNCIISTYTSRGLNGKTRPASYIYNSCSALHCNITRRSCFSCLLCSTSPMYLKYNTNSTSITLLQKPKNKRVYKDMVRLFNARDWLTSGTVCTMCH